MLMLHGWRVVFLTRLPTGQSVERCLLSPQPRGVKASLACELAAMLGGWAAGREGSARVHGGSAPPAPAQAVPARGLHWVTLSFCSFSIPREAALISQ